jgi:hypothetical protein
MDSFMRVFAVICRLGRSTGVDDQSHTYLHHLTRAWPSASVLQGCIFALCTFSLDQLYWRFAKVSSLLCRVGLIEAPSKEAMTAPRKSDATAASRLKTLVTPCRVVHSQASQSCERRAP